MKKIEDEIDNLFQTNVEPFEMTPPKKAWSSLDAALDKKQAVLYKKQAYRYKLISICISLLFICFISFQYFVPRNIPYSSANNNQISNSHVADMKSITPKNESVTESKTQYLPVSDNYTKESITVNSKRISQNENKIESISSRKLSSSNLVAEKENKNVNAFVRDRASINSSLNSKNNNDSIKNSAIILNNSQQSTIKKSEVLDGDNSKNNLVENKQSVNANSISLEQSIILKDSLNEGSKAKYLMQSVLTDSEVKNTDSVKSLQSPVVNSQPLIINTTATQIQKTNFDWTKLSVAAFFSPDFNFQHLTDNDNDNAPHHKDHSKAKDFDEKESSDFSFTAGAMVKYDLTSKWSIQSGCTYSTAVEKIQPTTIYAEQGTNSEAHYVLNTALGTVEIPNLAGTTPQVGDSIYLKTNSKQILHFINIPLMLRYQYVKNRFSYYGYTGMSANILVNEQSQISIQSQTSETIITGNITGLKKFTYSFLLGIGAQYNFQKEISVFIEPDFRWAITPINQNTAVISYPYSIGFNIGLMRHF